MTNYDSSSYEGIIYRIIWNNKYILSEGKSIFKLVFYNLGILKVRDLVSTEGVFPCYSSSLMGVFFMLSQRNGVL